MGTVKCRLRRVPGGGRDVRKRGPRPAFTLIEILVVVLISAMLMAMGTASFQQAQDRSRNAQMAGNVKTVAVALEKYADENGAYPNGSFFITGPNGFIDKGYLPGNKVPRSPWTVHPQTGDELNHAHQLVATGGTTFHDLQVAANSKTAPPGWTSMVGRLNDPPVDYMDFGMIRYQYIASSGVYVLLGNGKLGGNTVIVAPTSNGL